MVGVYYLIAPGASADVLAFAIGQLYIVLRVMVRLQFTASQTALFQETPGPCRIRGAAGSHAGPTLPPLKPSAP